jgi:hypothetical protein
MKLNVPASAWVDPNQHRVMKQIETAANAATAALAALQTPAVEQAYGEMISIEFADNKAYTFIKWPFAWTIDSVTTKCTTGTCTVTVSIDGVSLGGAANSVSTSEVTQAHTTANAVAVGQDIAITISANAAAEGVSVTLTGRRSFAVQ